MKTPAAEAKTDEQDSAWPGVPALLKHGLKASLSLNRSFLCFYIIYSLLIAAWLHYLAPYGFGYEYLWQDNTALNNADGSLTPAFWVVMLAGLVVQVAIIRYALGAVDGETLGLGAYAASLKRTLPLVAAWLIVGILVVLGLVLLIIPGLFLLVRFYMLPFVVVEKRKGIVGAIKHSFALTRGHFWKILLLLLAFLSLNLVAFAVLGAIPILRDIAWSLLALPFAVAFAGLYRWIEAHPKSK